jgi:hypothetical protein
MNEGNTVSTSSSDRPTDGKTTFENTACVFVKFMNALRVPQTPRQSSHTNSMSGQQHVEKTNDFHARIGQLINLREVNASFKCANGLTNFLVFFSLQIEPFIS